MSCILKVNNDVCDPVEGEVGIRSLPWNPFTGYFGYTRNQGTKKHEGYDYIASDQVAALAVQTGEIVQIRYGRANNLKACPFRNAFKANKNSIFQHTVCKDCDYRNGCYGVQVWLKIIDNQRTFYAFYAHLSQLSETITKGITSTSPLQSSNTLMNLSIKVQCRDKIGYCGSTGFAHEMLTNDTFKNEKGQEHLHFECRTAIEKSGVKLHSPNEIVKTKFYITDKATELETFNFIELNLTNFDDKLRAVYEMKEWLNHINSKKGQFEAEMQKKFGKKVWNLKSQDEKIRKREWTVFKNNVWNNFVRSKKWDDFIKKYKID